MQSSRELDSIEIFCGKILEASIHKAKAKAKFLKLKVLNRVFVILIADVRGRPIIFNLGSPGDERRLIGDIVTFHEDHIADYLVGVKVKVRNEIKIFDDKKCNNYSIEESNCMEVFEEELGYGIYGLIARI